MNIKSIMESAEVFLFICLIFALVLSAFIFFVVFCTNGEDWFFEIKLDGMPPGISLFGKMAGAVVIVYLMAHHPRYRRLSIPAVSGYYGFLCLDSFVTIRKNTQGRDYPVTMAVLSLVPVLLLIIHGTLTLTETGDHTNAEI